MGVLEGIIYMLWRGIAIGVVISAPMGPVGILCVQRTLEKGRRTGFLTGVGAALSDLIYCLITGFGLALVEDFLKENQNVIQLVGSVVLVFFGIYLFRSNPARSLRKPGMQEDAPHKHIISGFLFTFSNPLIIFLIIGLYARFNFLSADLLFYDYIIGFAAIISGALGWWWVVTYLVNKVRAHFNLRSMWLINKIIGSVIMIFAAFGMVTSISGIANAGHRLPRYMNSVRGFGELRQEGGTPLSVSNSQGDTLFYALVGADEMPEVVTFRLRSLNNKEGKGYAYLDSTGKEGTARHPAWGVGYRSGGGEITGLMLRTVDNPYDPLSVTGLEVKMNKNGGVRNFISSGLDFFTGWNSFRLRRQGAGYILEGGDRSFSELGVLIPGDGAGELGLILSPGAAVEVDYICMEYPSADSEEDCVDVLELMERLERSSDPIEGLWGEFDREVDDSVLLPGGDYRLAVVSRAGGYDIYYISGAGRNASLWREGMVKGGLEATPFRGVYNGRWRDVSGDWLGEEIKVQFTDPDLLTFHFPARASRIRFRRIR